MSKEYTVERNYCDCHPETCCCNDWNVINPKGEETANFYNESDAYKLVAELNKTV